MVTGCPPGVGYSPASPQPPQVTTLSPGWPCTSPVHWPRRGHDCVICLYRVEPTEAGDYKLCFDNSFSTISEKLVFFELIFDSLQDDEEVEGWADAVEPEEMLDVKMEDFKVRPGRTGSPHAHSGPVMLPSPGPPHSRRPQP